MTKSIGKKAIKPVGGKDIFAANKAQQKQGQRQPNRPIPEDIHDVTLLTTSGVVDMFHAVGLTYCTTRTIDYLCKKWELRFFTKGRMRYYRRVDIARYLNDIHEQIS